MIMQSHFYLFQRCQIQRWMGNTVLLIKIMMFYIWIHFATQGRELWTIMFIAL